MLLRHCFSALAAVVAFVSATPLLAQTTDSVVKRYPPSAYEGRHFYVGFMQNENYIIQGGLHLNIFIGATRPTKVAVIPPGSRIPTNYFITKDTIIMLEVPEGETNKYESWESEMIRYKLAEIIAEQPVTVYAMSWQDMSSDAYSILPITEWGRDYIVLSAPNDNYSDDPNDDPERLEIRQSEFLVMAANDNTLVVIVPSTKTEAGYNRGQTITITLNKGQCYLVKSSKQLPPGDGDLTGTIISADKPIGVLSGHVRASIPVAQYGRGDNSKDHLCEMLLPTTKWDSEYVSVPFDIFSQSGDFFRITTSEPNNEITYLGASISGSFTLTNPGDTATLGYIDRPLLWKGTKKFSIAQYMPTSFGTKNDNQEYDPAMVILPPRNRFYSRSMFQIIPNPYYHPQKFKIHYVALVVEAAAVRSLTLDGQKVADLNPNILTQMVPGRNLYWVNLSIVPGNHELKTDVGKFSGIIYGVGVNDSYAMTLGISMDNPEQDTLAPVVTYTNDCGILNGEATDKVSAEMTGIFSATVIQNTNFSYTVAPLTDTSRFLTFTAKPIDPTADGLIVFDVRDKAGNGRIVRHTYSAIKMTVNNKDIAFGAVNWLDSVCKTVTLRNTSSAPVVLGEVLLSGDSRVHFVPDISASLKNKSLAPGDSVSMRICFYPSRDSTPLAAVCQIKLPCNLALDIPITSKVVAPGLMAQDWDFGDVLVGDTACATIPIKNTGNIPMTIKEILTGQLPNFIFKLAGLTPDTLNPGETMLVPVCFTPDARLDYQEAGFAVDQTNGKTGFAVKGHGIAPLVLGSAIDWGKRRVGTVNDSVYWLVNKGNMNATIEIASQTGDNTAFATLASGVKGYEIKKGDSISVVASFLPPSNGIRQFTAMEGFKILNWKFHPPVNVTLSGEGTLPAVTTFDTDFGEVPVNKSKDSITLCATAAGNEPLTVDSIYVTAGDAQSFIIPASELRKMRFLQSGDSITLPVTFAPKTIGRHEITLAIVHDAMPNYKRRESLFRIFGNATPDDTLRAELTVKEPSVRTVPACSRQPLSMTVVNTGNRTLIIDSIYVSMPQQAKLISQDIPVLPYNLPPKDKVSGTFIFTTTGSGQFDIIFRTTTTANINLEGKSTILPTLNSTQAKITFDQLPAAPGQMGNMEISGTVTVTDTTPIQPFMTLSIPSKMVVFTTSGIMCEIDESGVKRLLPVSVQQFENETTIRFDQQILLTQNSRWNIILPYLLVLSDQLKTPVVLNFHDELGGCFTESSDQKILDVSAVCAQVIRVVKGMTGVYMLLGANPSPASSTAHIRYISPEPMAVTLEAVNSLGIRIPLGEGNLSGTSGELPVDISSLAAGAYRLVAHSERYGSRDVPLIVIP